jgi:transcriptional regulator with XRE-family HTH domain
MRSPSAQVRAGRALLAWSQQDLARSAKVATSTIADFERGQRSPNQDSLDSIRGAFEAAGVRFTAGGAVLNASQRLEPFKIGSPIRWIEASDLNDWADRRAGQDGAPQLLSRLIRATRGAEAKIRFPAEDSVQYAGWDGQCEVADGWGPLPSGVSGWEIGVQRHKIRAKADEDYQNRGQDPIGLNPAETTFVFVTLRRWPSKEKWAAARRAEGVWRDVRAIDGDDLVPRVIQNEGKAASV